MGTLHSSGLRVKRRTLRLIGLIASISAVLATSAPSPASASPAARTDAVTSTGAFTATVAGEVDPNGQTTTYVAAYDLESSDWCQGGGGAGKPAFETTAQTLAATDSSFHPVTVPIQGLAPGTEYCVEIDAKTNPSQVAYGTPPVRFIAGVPVALTGSATVISGNSVTVNGDVNPNDQPTTYFAKYASADSPWCQSGGDPSVSGYQTTSPQPLGVADNTLHAVQVTIPGLTTGSAYCAVISATDTPGNADGLPPVSFTVVLAPLATLGAATATSGTTEHLTGTVNPRGTNTNYSFRWDLAATAWCTSGGTSGSPSNSTAPMSAGSSTSAQTEAADIGSLMSGVAYCWQVVARNGSGDAFSPIGQFVAGLPTAGSSTAANITSSAAMLQGTVNPNGSSTEYQFQYGTTTAYGEFAPSTPQPAGAGTLPIGVQVQVNGLSPNTTYHFRVVAISGLGTDTGPDATFTTPAAGQVGRTLQLAIGGTGSGSVTTASVLCPGTCSATYPDGTRVTLVATPAPGSRFSGWGGACSGASTCSLTMSSDHIVTATFTSTAGPPPPRPSCTLTATGNTVRLKKPKTGRSSVAPGTISVKAKCGQAASVKLTGVLIDTGNKPKHARARTRTFKLGPVRRSVAANAVKVLAVRLPAGALSDLRARHRESVRFTLTGTNATGTGRCTLTIRNLRGR